MAKTYFKQSRDIGGIMLETSFILAGILFVMLIIIIVMKIEKTKMKKRINKYYKMIEIRRAAGRRHYHNAKQRRLNEEKDKLSDNNL